MTNRDRLLWAGTRRGERLCREFGETVREGRLGLGATQKQLGEIVGLAASQISRIESAQRPYPDFVQAARLAQVLGFDLSIKTFATGAAVRDAAQVKLVEKLCGETPLVRWSLEEVIPIPGDMRGWDAVGRVDGVSFGVAAETRVRDAQALLRRENAKMRDSGLDFLILLLAGTHANRAMLRDIREALRPQLPLDTRELLGSLRQGRSPGGSGIILL